MPRTATSRNVPDRAQRPDPDEYADFYAGYVRRVPEGDVVETLSRQFEGTRSLLAAVPPDRERWRYADDKWSIREVVGHLLDTERVFSLRTLWVARAADGEQPGMDQDAWAAASNASDRALPELLEEWAAVRRATVLMLRGLPGDAWLLRGRASDVEFTTRALAWISAGHELHHREGLERDYGLGG